MVPTTGILSSSRSRSRYSSRSHRSSCTRHSPHNNRSNRSSLRTQIKKLRTALAGNDAQQSQELLTPTISAIDKAVNKGVLHKNTAARYKARLTGHVNKSAQK